MANRTAPRAAFCAICAAYFSARLATHFSASFLGAILAITFIPAHALPPWSGLSDALSDYVLPQVAAETGRLPYPADPAFHPPILNYAGNHVGFAYDQPMSLLRSGFTDPALGGPTRTTWLQHALADNLIYQTRFSERHTHLGYAQDSSGLFLHAASSGLTQALSLRLGLQQTFTAQLRLPIGPAGGTVGAKMLWQLDAEIGPSGTGFSTSLALHHSRTRTVVTAKVPGYTPLEAEGSLALRGVEAGLGYRMPGLALEWRGALDHAQGIHPNEPTLATAFEGWLGRQGGALTWVRPQAFTARLEGEGLLGNGTVIGYRGQTGPKYPFVYAPFDVFALRAALSIETETPWLTLGAGPQGAYGLAHLLRPDDPAGRWLWNRNLILDAYQGSLTGLFSRQTWLGTGRAEWIDIGGAVWAERRFLFGRASDLASGRASGFAANPPSGLKTRLLTSLHHLEYGATAKVLKRDTELLIATRETLVQARLPRESRWVLRPQASLTWQPWPEGRLGLFAQASQAIPLGHAEKLDGRGNEDVTQGNGDDASAIGKTWRGGLAWSMSVTWALVD